MAHNGTANEVAERIEAGNKYYYGLTKLLNSSAMSVKLKKQLYTSIIRPVILYSSKLGNSLKKGRK